MRQYASGASPVILHPSERYDVSSRIRNGTKILTRSFYHHRQVSPLVDDNVGKKFAMDQQIQV